jgi:hypothetical protein
MKLPARFDGAKVGGGYVGIRSQLYATVEKTNGTISDAGTTWPKLSNGQVVALVQAWRRAAARSSRPSWPLSSDLLRAALGWRATGDRFVMTTQHAASLAAPELLQLFWLSTGELADQLDGVPTVKRPLVVDYSFRGYEAAARQEWSSMQAEAKIPGPKGPIEVPDPKLPVKPVLPVVPSVGGGGLLLLLLLLAAFATKKRN